MAAGVGLKRPEVLTSLEKCSMGFIGGVLLAIVLLALMGHIGIICERIDSHGTDFCALKLKP